MNRREQDRLLEEIFGREDADALRHTSLEQGLKALRRRRRARRAIAAGLGAAAVAALALMFIVKRGGPSQEPSVAAIEPAPPESGTIQYITEEDLRYLLADRAYALIGPPGRQQFVFLDQPPDARL